MAGIGEIVALAKGLGGSGGGSSGGGVLVVNRTWDDEGTTCTLDKTWQEIHDGMPAVIIEDDGDDRYMYSVQSAIKAPDDTGFVVTVGSMAGNTAYTDNYLASSASSYPSISL